MIRNSAIVLIHRTLMCLLLFGCALTAEAKPKFPPPPDSNVSSMGESMSFNGLPMNIRIFASKNSVEDVLAYYRNFWPDGTKEKPGYTETDIMAPWRLITRVENGYLMTVQVRANKDRGSNGYLGLSRLPDPGEQPELGKDFPKMRGTYVMNDILSKDQGKNGRTLLLLNRASVQTNASFYRDHFLNRGWTTDMDKDISGGKVHTLRFRNGNKSVSIVINGGDKTVITAQVVKEGLF